MQTPPAGTSPDRWKKSLVPVTSTLGEVIRNLDASTLQIALVVSPDGALIGTITDGDIRRGLLRGLDMNSPIDSIVQRDPLVVPQALGHETVRQLMQANGIRQIPVVDDARKVVGLHTMGEVLVSATRPNVMVIMAGGEGTRLRPFTEKCPKPLLPVDGKPMLEHILERAKAEGFQRFVVAVHYLGHMIVDHFGDGSAWHVHIDYIREDAPLGTAGAIGLLRPRPDGPFLVTNGDVLTDVRYGELLDFHCRNGAVATMAVRLHVWRHPFGVVHINGVDIVGFDEKPIARSHVNAGVYVLEPAALDALHTGERCDMPTLFGRLQDNGARTIVYPMYEPWLDVGQPAEYSHASAGGRSPVSQDPLSSDDND